MEIEIIKSRAGKANIFKVYKTESGKREWVEVFLTEEKAEEFAARLTKSKSGDKSKSKKIAIFSNGFTREYKGDRNVKAAWAIINKDTSEVILSGFSMGTAAAEGSARNRRKECYCIFEDGDKYKYPHDMRGRCYPWRLEKQYKKENRERLAIIDSKVKIEIVRL